MLQAPCVKASNCELSHKFLLSSSDELVGGELDGIGAIGYSPLTRQLGIEFRKSGDVYFYFEVPLEDYQGFMAADSKGEYLNRIFRTKGYSYSGPHRQRNLPE